MAEPIKVKTDFKGNWSELNQRPYTSFSSAFALYKIVAGLTQQQIADKTGIAQPVIGRLLKDAKPELPTLQKLAEGLDIAISITPDGVSISQLRPKAEREAGYLKWLNNSR